MTAVQPMTPAVVRSIYDPLSLAELAALPPVDWLIDGLLPAESFGMLFGKAEAGKSLAALDLGLSIAAGTADWFGHAITPGPVVYLVGEGLRGLSRRAKAWQAVHPGAKVHRFHIVPNMPPLADPEAVDAVLEALGRHAILEAALVVVDTWFRATPGADENSVQDVGPPLLMADHLRRELGATLLIIHHEGIAPGRERGSTAVRAACDTVLHLTRDEDIHTLKVAKQRDGDHAEPLRLRLTTVPPSVVFQPADEPAELLTPKQRTVLEALQKGGAMTYTALVESSPTARSTAAGLVRSLIGLGMIEKSGLSHRLTAKGSEALA